MQLSTVLKTYGLNEKQAKVYLACLEIGSGPAQRISELANLPRSTCYEVLEGLKTQGLVSSFQKKKIKWFNAEDPHTLVRQAKEKAALLEESLPQFMASYSINKNRPSVRFYQGKQGMKIILEEIIKDKPKEVCGFSSADDLFNILGEIWPNFIKKRMSQKIFARVILRHTSKSLERQRLGPEELREVRIIPAIYDYHGITYIWKNKVAMFSFQNDIIALVIESPELSQMQQAEFEVIWQQLPEFKKT